MTNEEKSKEIVHRMHFVIPYQGASPKNLKSEMNSVLLEMAEWKDQQFKEYLERLQERFVEYDKHSNWLVIQEIINELFIEE